MIDINTLVAMKTGQTIEIGTKPKTSITLNKDGTFTIQHPREKLLSVPIRKVVAAIAELDIPGSGIQRAIKGKCLTMITDAKEGVMEVPIINGAVALIAEDGTLSFTVDGVPLIVDCVTGTQAKNLSSEGMSRVMDAIRARNRTNKINESNLSNASKSKSGGSRP